MSAAVRQIWQILLSVALVLLGAATASFLAFRVIPGDPVSVMLGPHAQVSESVKAGIRHDLGLDRPLAQQYIEYIGALLRGDFGQSYQLRLPVTEVIGRQLGATVQLSVVAILIAALLVLVGVVLARGTVMRGLVGLVEIVVLASPIFWIGLVLLSVFAFMLGWFPVAGSKHPAAVVLPALTLAVVLASLIGQVLRDGMMSAEQQPFATTVRARGAGYFRLTVRHTLRHGSVGAITLAAYLVGSILGGAVLVEQVFARPGVGRVALTAIIDRDFPVLTGVIMLSAVVFVLVNTAVELLLPVLDPRLKQSSARGADQNPVGNSVVGNSVVGNSGEAQPPGAQR